VDGDGTANAEKQQGIGRRRRRKREIQTGTSVVFAKKYCLKKKKFQFLIKTFSMSFKFLLSSTYDLWRNM